MPLTRKFRDTVWARAQRDARFRAAMLSEAINELLAGDLDTGKSHLRDYVCNRSSRAPYHHYGKAGGRNVPFNRT